MPFLRKGLFLLIISLLFFSQARAQNAQEAAQEAERFRGKEEEIDKTKIRRIPEKVPVPEFKKPPAEEKEAKFFVKTIKLKGIKSFPPEDFLPIIEKYQNRELTLSDLENLSRQLEAEYIKKGVIAAVLVVPQEVKNQEVTLQVVEAKMGDLRIENHKYFNSKRLSSYWEIPSGEVIHYEKLSRSIQRMNRNPDRQVKANLYAGSKPETTDVLLSPQTSFPLHFAGSFDNEGIVSTGKNRITLGGQHNNFLGLDDIFLAGYSFGREFDGLYAYHNIPLNFKGTNFLYGYSQSRSSPKKEFAVFDISSKAKNVSLSLRQDIYVKEDYRGEVYLGFDAKDKTVKLKPDPSDPDAVPFNRDRLRIFTLGGSFVYRGISGLTYITPEIAQGVNAFGASGNGNPLATRGAKSRFTKLSLGAQRRMRLFSNNQANLRFKSQFSSTKLTTQEQFSLGGLDSVRGYPPSDYLADNAVFSSAEFFMPVFFIPDKWKMPYAGEPLKDTFSLVSFLDYGYGRKRGALDSEKKSVNFVGIGTGLRINFYNQAVLRLEWGFPIGDRPITESGRSRFHFSVNIMERLPGEIERIRIMKRERSQKKVL